MASVAAFKTSHAAAWALLAALLDSVRVRTVGEGEKRHLVSLGEGGADRDSF